VGWREGGRNELRNAGEVQTGRASELHKLFGEGGKRAKDFRKRSNEETCVLRICDTADVHNRNFEHFWPLQEKGFY
jgi:hypothetical protein